MQLINGYSYDNKTRELKKKHNDKNISVKLTKTEQQVVDLMATKHPLATLEDFANIVWLGKNFSRATLRNKIKSIREKTCYQLIKNNSNIGYGLNTK